MGSRLKNYNTAKARANNLRDAFMANGARCGEVMKHGEGYLGFRVYNMFDIEGNELLFKYSTRTGEAYPCV